MDQPAGTTRQLLPRPSHVMTSVMPPLAALRTAPSDARAYVRSALASWKMSHLADVVEVIVSELVANAVNASTDEKGRPLDGEGVVLLVWVRLYLDGASLTTEVWDEAPGVPVLGDAGADSESGRGLALVRDLSDAWDWHPARGRPGKCVWASISVASLTVPLR